jgi:hypothetical protein
VLQGLVAGIMAGAAVFLATVWLVARGGAVVGPHLALLGQFFPGYEVTLAGAVIGLAWGFAYGFASGYLVSVLYNWLVRVRRGR